MKECIKEAYEYYHNPLCKECENEFKNLPILFGRKKQEKTIREKYKQKGLNVVRYEDFLYSEGKLEFEARGGLKACAIFMGNGYYICGIDGSEVGNCDYCRHGNHCKKLQSFLWSDLHG
ncbi:MAG: hypothetical protein ACI4IL_02155 [Eubacterium sp.]